MSDEDKYFYTGMLIVLVLLMFYSILSAYIEIRRPLVGHEAAIIILIGVALSYILELVIPKTIDFLTLFDSMFFDTCLPLIIFSKGFNMKRKRFVENFGVIFKYGVLGTIIQFLILCGLNILVFKVIEFSVEEQQVQTREILFLSTILSSSEFLFAIKSLNVSK